MSDPCSASESSADISCRPEKDTSENTRFNYHVSRVRVRSEHCVGYLKGRWSSLRGLRIGIHEQSHVAYTSLWITACIVLHNFAMQHERGIDVASDEFLTHGIEIVRREKEGNARRREAEMEHAAHDEEVRVQSRDVELLRARIKRETIKAELMEYLDG